MRYLRLLDILEVYHRVVSQSGGSFGFHNLHALGSAVAQPRITFGGADLYPTTVEKAAALGFFLIKNHPFLDGNKRVGHAAMELFLVLNGYRITATIEEQEQVILQLASNELDREGFVDWLRKKVVEYGKELRR